MRIPGETEALLLVAFEAYLSVDLAVGLGAVLGAVKDEDGAVDGESSNQIGVLRAVARLVHFGGVVDLLGDVPGHALGVGLAMAADLAALLVVVAGIGGGLGGDGDLGNLDVVGLVVRGVGADEGAVDAAVLASRLLDVGEPLDGEGGPGEGRAGADQEACSAARDGRRDSPEDHIIEEGRVFLPGLVL